MITQKIDQSRAANLRAGLIASVLVNIHRRRGTRPVKPSDFLAEPKEHLEAQEAATFLDAWAARQNRKVEAVRARVAAPRAPLPPPPARRPKPRGPKP